MLVRRARVAVRFRAGGRFRSVELGKWGERRLRASGKEGYPLGTFRKRKPHDCGRTRCMLCRGEKLMRIGEAKAVRDAWHYEQLAGGV